ncbi:MAG: FGLLP motif-containing membrane protein, partial [Dehalococcoidia bacterium]
IEKGTRNAAPPTVRVEAPVTVVIRLHPGLAIYETNALTSQMEWGDGAVSPITTLPCPDGTSSYWPGQDLTHQYASPGTYSTTWRFNAAGQDFSIPFLVVFVTQPAPPTLTTAPQTQAPSTSVPVTPGAAVTTEGQSPTASATSAPGSSPSPTTRATATTTPTATATEAVTPASVVTPDGSGAGGSQEPVSTPVANAENRPEAFLPIETFADISKEPDVVATNLVIAGVTVWVLFTSVLLNQVLQENRAEIDRKTAWLSAPVRRLRTARPPRWERRIPAFVRRLALPMLVLLVTGFVYSILEPGFGANRQTAALFVRALLGVGLMTYLSSGLEAVAARRWTGARAAVRPFPACIAIAVASVALSRLLDLHPGVMYGFVASCAVAAPVQATSRQTGRVALTPVAVALTVAVGAWLMVGPIRDLNESRGGWLPGVLEATVIVVFLGGIEGTILSMLPLPETDGGKIYRWHRWLWLAITLAAAFLTWHVLFGRERAYFGGLREASSLSVFFVFAGYTVLTAGVWAYFRFRDATPTAEPAPGPSTAG